MASTSLINTFARQAGRPTSPPYGVSSEPPLPRPREISIPPPATPDPDLLFALFVNVCFVVLLTAPGDEAYRNSRRTAHAARGLRRARPSGRRQPVHASAARRGGGQHLAEAWGTLAVRFNVEVDHLTLWYSLPRFRRRIDACTSFGRKVTVFVSVGESRLKPQYRAPCLGFEGALQAYQGSELQSILHGRWCGRRKIANVHAFEAILGFLD